MLVGCKGVARRWRPSSARRWPKKKLCELHQSGLAKTDFIEGAHLLFLHENKGHMKSATRRAVTFQGDVVGQGPDDAHQHVG
jgi:hypothetical protein